MNINFQFERSWFFFLFIVSANFFVVIITVSCICINSIIMIRPYYIVKFDTIRLPARPATQPAVAVCGCIRSHRKWNGKCEIMFASNARVWLCWPQILCEQRRVQSMPRKENIVSNEHFCFCLHNFWLVFSVHVQATAPSRCPTQTKRKVFSDWKRA